MPEVPRALPRMSIDVAAEVARLSAALGSKASAPQGATLPEIEVALLAAYNCACLLEDCQAPASECKAAAEAVERLARRAADHTDADIAAPRALALERASLVLRVCG